MKVLLPWEQDSATTALTVNERRGSSGCRGARSFGGKRRVCVPLCRLLNGGFCLRQRWPAGSEWVAVDFGAVIDAVEPVDAGEDADLDAADADSGPALRSAASRSSRAPER